MMAEYIEREKLKYDLRNWIVDYEVNGEHETADCLRECIDLIDDTPTAEVVEIVRCKDCKWHDSVDGPMRQCDITDDDDFCSYGEREDKQSET